MKRISTPLLCAALLLSVQCFAQRDAQNLTELRKFSQQGWRIQHGHISFDSLTIYFSAQEPGNNNYELYATHSRAGFWSTPEKLGSELNTSDDELWPTISSDEQRLVFIRRTYDPKLYKSSKGAQGVYDRLYMSEKIRGTWQKAEPVMVASDNDLSPLIFPDNQTIVYSRRENDKRTTYYALYFTKYIGYGVWTLPQRVDSTDRRSLFGPYLKQLNDTVLRVTEQQVVERDKKEFDTLYLNRQVTLPKAVRSNPYGVLSGMVTDENSGRAVEATIRLYDAITANQLDEAQADATTGRFRVALHPGHRYNIDITAPNYSHYYMTLDCNEEEAIRSHHVQVQIARNLTIRINPFDADLYVPAVPERDLIKNVATDKNVRARTKRDERGRVYELPIGEEYALTLFRRGYIDTTIIIDTRKDVRFSTAEMDIPMQPVKVPLTIRLEEGKEGTIRLRNRNKHEVIEMPYTPPTTTIMVRQEDEYEMVIQSPGHFFFDTLVSVREGFDSQLCDVALTPIKKDMVVQLHNINFENNSYVLSPSSYIELEKVVRLMEANPELHIELSAHTDDIGSDAYNDQLSAKRGEATVAYLVKKGIARERLTSTGYGKRRPLVPNDSDENRAINRRVEFKVTEF